MIAGLLGGLLGVGGGFIMVPLLIAWGRLPAHQANGTSLAAIIPIATVGALLYYFGSEKPQIDLPVGFLIAAGSMVGAYTGARLAGRIPERSLLIGLSVLLAILGVKEVIAP